MCRGLFHPTISTTTLDTMWKLALGFVVFAGILLFVMKKYGADVDMSGEKHGIEVHPAASAPEAASAASK